LHNEASTGGNHNDIGSCVVLPSNPSSRDQDLTNTDWIIASNCACYHSGNNIIGMKWTADFLDGEATITHIKFLGRQWGF
jgi:hypothetical protein